MCAHVLRSLLQKSCGVLISGYQKKKSLPTVAKVRSFLEHSCVILISFKIVIIFNTTSADIKTKSADLGSPNIRQNICFNLHAVTFFSRGTVTTVH